MDAEPTAAAEPVEEQPTQLGDAAAEGETQSIHAWSLADDEADTEVVHRRSWKVPIALAAAALVAVGGAGAYASWPERNESATAPAQKPSSAAVPAANPLPPQKTGGRMVDHNLQLQGEPKDWTAVESDLHQQGIDIKVNAVGVVTSLNFADLDTAPSNWLRWYAKHVSDEPWEPGPTKSVAWLDAKEAGLPVPPPPKICYSSGGTPVPIEQFTSGPYSDCGPTPGAMGAGH